MERIKHKINELEHIKKEIRDDFREFLNKNKWNNKCELVINGSQMFISWNLPYLTIEHLNIIDSDFEKVREVRIGNEFNGNYFMIYLEV